MHTIILFDRSYVFCHFYHFPINWRLNNAQGILQPRDPSTPLYLLSRDGGNQDSVPSISFILIWWYQVHSIVESIARYCQKIRMNCAIISLSTASSRGFLGGRTAMATRHGCNQLSITIVSSSANSVCYIPGRGRQALKSTKVNSNVYTKSLVMLLTHARGCSGSISIVVSWSVVAFL